LVINIQSIHDAPSEKLQVILNMFRAARCSKHVEDRSVTYILLKNKGIVH